MRHISPMTKSDIKWTIFAVLLMVALWWSK